MEEDKYDEDLLSIAPKSTKLFGFNWASGLVSPYRETKETILERVFDYLRPSKSDCILDLGCGEGKVLIEFAKKFECKCYGYDLDNTLLLAGNQLEHLIELSCVDIMTTQFPSDVTIVYLYLLPEALEKLKPVLLRNAIEKGLTVVSIMWAIPYWDEFRKDTGVDSFHVYRK